MPSAPPPPPDPRDALDQRRRRRAALGRPAPKDSSRGPATVRQLVPDRSEPCDHLHDTTSRYDHSAKVLSLLLVCPACKTEKLIHSLNYEPRFEPNGQPEAAGATVHQLRTDQRDQPTRRAA